MSEQYNERNYILTVFSLITTSVKTHIGVISLPFFAIKKVPFNKKFDFHGWHKNMTTTSKKKRRIFCPCCGSTNLCLLEHETICRECGLVLQGVPSIDHYIYGYIIGGKRQMYTDKEDRINHHAKK